MSRATELAGALPRWRNGQDVAGGLDEHPFGDAAQERVTDAAASVRADDEEVGLVRFHRAQDHILGPAVVDQRNDARDGGSVLRPERLSHLGEKSIKRQSMRLRHRSPGSAVAGEQRAPRAPVGGHRRDARLRKPADRLLQRAA